MVTALTRSLCSFGLLLIFIQDRPATYHAFVTTRENGLQGSAVYVGNGFFVTATHVISRYDGEWHDFRLNFNRQEYRPQVLVTNGDYALLRALMVSHLPPPRLAEPIVGMRVFWIQALNERRNLIRLQVEARIAYVSDGYFYMDKPTFPATSGTGIFTENGALVGIIVSTLNYYSHPAFAIGWPVRVFVEQNIPNFSR